MPELGQLERTALVYETIIENLRLILPTKPPCDNEPAMLRLD